MTQSLPAEQSFCIHLALEVRFVQDEIETQRWSHSEGPSRIARLHSGLWRESPLDRQAPRNTNEQSTAMPHRADPASRYWTNLESLASPPYSSRCEGP